MIASKFRYTALVCMLFLQLIPLFSQNGKLFLVAGQSNAVGQGDASTSTVCAPGTAYEYNALTNSIQHLQDPIGQNSNNLQPAASGSIGPAFSNTLNTLINQPVYLVSAARGGSSNGVKAELSSFGTWDDSGTLMLFGSAVDKTKKAIQASGLALSGIIWVQGERDANAIRTGNETEAEYQAALEKVISRFRNEFGPRLPFYIVLTGLQGVVTNGTPVAIETAANYAVRRIQKAVAAKLANVFVAYSSTDTFFDKGWMKPETTTVHYTQAAYNQIGDSVARFVSTITYDTIANIEPIPVPNSANPQIIIDNTDAACTYDAPWTQSTYNSGFYGTNYANDGSAGADPTKWAKWTPTIPTTANYNIFMRWTAGPNRPAAAPVEIKHANGTKSITVDQTINNNSWQFLGTYSLASGNTNYVKLSAAATGYTLADAVLFEQINVNTILKQTDCCNKNFRLVNQHSQNNLRAAFKMTEAAHIKLSVYNALGIEIYRVIDKKLAPQNYEIPLVKSTMKKGLYVAVMQYNEQIVDSEKFILN